MPQILPSDHPLVQATATLLSEDPSLTNAHLLRKLPRLVRASVVQEVPVTHFQRRVRQPAERVLRQRVTNGTPGELKSSAPAMDASGVEGRSNGARAPSAPTSQPSGTAPEASSPPSGNGRSPTLRSAESGGEGAAAGREGASAGKESAPVEKERAPARRGVARARREAVDEALVEAFELGVTADSEHEVVTAYRHLEAIRRELQAALSRG